MIIYLSGPMSGIKNMNYEEFNAVAKRLRTQGYEVINPAEMPMPDFSAYQPTTPEGRLSIWFAFMRQDIKVLMDADTVALLPGWEKSKGARIEVYLAQSLNMEVIDAYTLKAINLVAGVK